MTEIKKEIEMAIDKAREASLEPAVYSWITCANELLSLLTSGGNNGRVIEAIYDFGHIKGVELTLHYAGLLFTDEESLARQGWLWAELFRHFLTEVGYDIK